MKTEADQEQETDIATVNINSMKFNSNFSMIIANLQTSSYKVIITVPYKVDTGSDGSITLLYIYKQVISLGNGGAIGSNKKYKHETKNV